MTSMGQLLLGEVLARSARRHPQQDALVWPGGSISYGAMNDRADALAHALLGIGVRKGDKVAFLMHNRAELLEACFAAFKMGAVAVPMNFRLTAREIEYILKDSDASVLILEEALLEIARPALAGLQGLKDVIVVGDLCGAGMRNYEDFLKSAATGELTAELVDDDVALIVYTSGTTGQPKGAVLTHTGLMVTALNYLISYQNRCGDKWICTTPIFHIAGMSYSMTHFYVGATILLERDFDPLRILELTHSARVTTLFLVPSMWIKVLQVPDFASYDTSSVRIITTAAAIMPVEIKKQLAAAFPAAGLYDCFGGTESGAVTVLSERDFARKNASVGLALPYLEIRLVDDDDRDVPRGQIGEAVYRGPNVMKEYYKNPEATLRAMRGGWFHSGDLLRQDEEGFYYVVDRKDDMIISGGENIYPAEVEEVLFSHPAILEAAVVAVPDPEWGQNVKAFVVLKADRSLSESEVIEYCKLHLASYKKPKSVEFLASLPKSAAGKILKRALRP